MNVEIRGKFISWLGRPWLAEDVEGVVIKFPEGWVVEADNNQVIIRKPIIDGRLKVKLAPLTVKEDL